MSREQGKTVGRQQVHEEGSWWERPAQATGFSDWNDEKGSRGAREPAVAGAFQKRRNAERFM